MKKLMAIAVCLLFSVNVCYAKISKKTWMWIAAGVVAVGVGVTVALAANKGHSKDKDDFYDHYKPHKAPKYNIPDSGPSGSSGEGPKGGEEPSGSSGEGPKGGEEPSGSSGEEPSEPKMHNCATDEDECHARFGEDACCRTAGPGWGDEFPEGESYCCSCTTGQPLRW